MSQTLVFVRANALRDVLRYARELALQLDAESNAADPNLVEVKLVRALEVLERDLPEDMRTEWKHGAVSSAWPVGSAS